MVRLLQDWRLPRLWLCLPPGVLFLGGCFSSPICFLLTNSLAFHSAFDIAALSLPSGHSTCALPAFRVLFLLLPSPSFTLWTFVLYYSMYIWYHWRWCVLGKIQHFNSTYRCRMRIHRLAVDLLFGNHQWNVSLFSFSFPAAAVKVFLSSAKSPFSGSCESTYWALYLRRWTFAETPSPFYFPPPPTLHEHTFSHLFFSPVSPFIVVDYSPLNAPPSHSRNISLLPLLPDKFLLPILPPVILAMSSLELIV